MSALPVAVAVAVGGVLAVVTPRPGAGAEPLPASAPAADADPYLIVHSAPDAAAPVAATAMPTLRFLHSNRAFLLTRLSAHAGPGSPDPRLKSWLDEKMMWAVAGLGAAEQAVPHGNLVRAADWPEIEALAATLDSLTGRITGIDARLVSIRDDFANNQATELLIVLAAAPETAGVPEAALLTWNGHELAATELPAADRSALTAGGYRPLHRTFCRPEAQRIDIDLTLAGGRRLEGQVAVSPERNRLTVVVFGVESTGVKARVWTL
jgi:hypothetical protein